MCATVLWLDLACQWLILSLYSFHRPRSPYRVSIDAPTFQRTRASAGARTHIQACVYSAYKQLRPNVIYDPTFSTTIPMSILVHPDTTLSSP